MNKNFVLKKFKTDKLRLKVSEDELIKIGEKHAEQFPIEKVCDYKGTDRDVVTMIKDQENTMIPELLPLRHKRMMKNTFSFLRGTDEIMEYDLRQETKTHIPVMICGDAHLNNFGFFGSPERQILFGVNDFDETGVGNWENDLKRLMVSAQLAGEINGYDQKDIDKALIATAKNYKTGVKYGNSLKLIDRFYLSYNINDLLKFVSDDHQMKKILKKIAEHAPKNNSKKVVEKDTVEQNGKLVFKENPPRARKITSQLYSDMLAAFDQYRKNVSTDIQLFLSNYKVTDIIRYSVGVGSFGTRCYLFLLTGNDGSHLVLQGKEALPSKYDLMSMTMDDAKKEGVEAGKRVITGQSILQTFYDPFLGFTQGNGRSYYIRQFRNMKDSIDISKLDLKSFIAYSRLCGYILAIAHYQSPTAPMIYGYLDKTKKFEKNMTKWAKAYSQQVHKDYNLFEKYLRGDE